jgi:hypothetical protein
MNTHTHTQGPWRVENWIYQNAREVVTIQTDKDAIATACNLWRDGDDSTFEVMANARLIAAAPEMLAALEELCADKYLADPINADRMANALAVIAKVKGGDA